MRPLTLVWLLLLGAFASAQAAPAKHPFTFEEMMALRRISDPAISRDGRWVMFSAQDVNLQENTKRNHLWLVPVAGGPAKQITSSAAGEERGRFSPDGRKIAYISSRDGSAQIWIQPFDTGNGALSGEARKVTNISTETDGMLWVPDGRSLVFTSEVYPDCPDDACNKEHDDVRSKSRVKAVVFSHLYYRHWSSYTRFKRSHLFIVPAEGGVARDLTPGDHDVPPFNLEGQDFYALSPDSKELAYTSNVDEVQATSTNNDVFIVPLAGGRPTKISTSPGSDSTPLYSPDGRYIAFRSQRRNGYESDQFRLTLYDRTSHQLRDLTGRFDDWVGTIAWSADSKRIYFNSEVEGSSPVFVVDLAGGEPRRALAGHDDDMQFSPDGKMMVFTRMSAEAPSEVFKVDLNANGTSAGDAQMLSHLNDNVLAQVQTSPGEPFWFTGAHKTKVQGFIVKPPAFDANQRYPVKFLIHGGPQGDWGDNWSYRWNAQLFAAGGYVVVMINPRGSVGYGQRFVEEVSGDWGGRAYEDLMRGLDYVEAHEPYIAKGQECAMGASYGGYMVNWIIGHTTRFKCAVSHDGMFDAESAWGSTEELFFNEWEFKGTPWTNRALYRKWSPALAAPNFKTPTLVSHGQLDYRLDVSQGFELFNTLQRLKVPSRMMYFPDEGHWVLKPQNSQFWYKTVNDWVDSYLKK